MKKNDLVFFPGRALIRVFAAGVTKAERQDKAELDESR
jgi:hypothetical protein